MLFLSLVMDQDFMRKYNKTFVYGSKMKMDCK